ncbi:O-antigen ligase family protein, partial [Alphaproteobacteria bacterium]|nr:O-antigen ligase family protein [Alphaproteobacteria bacterium]
MFILILILSSLIFSENLKESLISSLLYAPYFFYFVAGIFFFSQFKLKNYTWLYWSILISILILFLFILYEAFNSPYPTNDTNYNGLYFAYEEGFKSLFSNKILGHYLIKVFPLLVGLSLMIYKKINYLTLSFLAIAALMIFFSYNRTSIFLLILMNILILLIFSEYRRPFMRFILLFMPVLFIIFLITPIGLNNLFDKTKNQLIKEKGIQIYPDQYLGHFYTTFKIIKLNPLTGAGTDSFAYNCSNQKYEYFYNFFYDENNNKVKLDSCSTHPHNFYLQIFSENGILAFLMFVFFYIYLIRELILSRKKN